VLQMGVQKKGKKGNFYRRRGDHCKVKGRSAVSCAKTAEPIEMPFGLWTRVGPREHVLHAGAHWRNLANTIEPCMFGGPAKTATPIAKPFGVWTPVGTMY